MILLFLSPKLYTVKQTIFVHSRNTKKSNVTVTCVCSFVERLRSCKIDREVFICDLPAIKTLYGSGYTGYLLDLSFSSLLKDFAPSVDIDDRLRSILGKSKCGFWKKLSEVVLCFSQAISIYPLHFSCAWEELLSFLSWADWGLKMFLSDIVDSVAWAHGRAGNRTREKLKRQAQRQANTQDPCTLDATRKIHCGNRTVHIAGSKQGSKQQASEWDLAPFLVAPCCSQGATLQVTLQCHLSHPLPPKRPPPPKYDFWAAQAILSNFYFWKKENWQTPQNFFSPKFFFFHPKFCFIPNFFFI